MPRWGKGPYAGKLGSTSQTIGITAWTKYPEVVGDFIMFMHTPERMSSWFKTTGAFPADDRFNTKLIKLPQQKVLFDLVKNGAPYLENFIPTEFDAKANFANAQLLLAGKIDAKQAAAASEQVAARIRRTNRDLISNFATWAKSYKRTSIPGVAPMSAPGASLATPLPRRRRRVRLGRAEPLVWIAPALAVVVFVFGYSMVELARQALEHKGHWVGLENFRLTVTDPTFQTALDTTRACCSRSPSRRPRPAPVRPALRGSPGLALPPGDRLPALRAADPGRRRDLRPMLQLDGLLNKALRGAGLEGSPSTGSGSPGWALWTMTGVIVWKELGLGVILFLARLLSLPAETFEAARIDGARFFRLHRT